MEKHSLVLDASVIIKWFSQEKSREKALDIRERFAKDEVDIVIPDLLLYELANALRFNPNFNSKDVKDAVESILDMNLNIVIPLAEILNEAVEVAFSKNITLYDAFYVALAKAIDFTFVTADKELYNKIKDFSFVVLLDKY